MTTPKDRPEPRCLAAGVAATTAATVLSLALIAGIITTAVVYTKETGLVLLALLVVGFSAAITSIILGVLILIAWNAVGRHFYRYCQERSHTPAPPTPRSQRPVWITIAVITAAALSPIGYASKTLMVNALNSGAPAFDVTALASALAGVTIAILLIAAVCLNSLLDPEEDH